jgi:hypothetical protein
VNEKRLEMKLKKMQIYSQRYYRPAKGLDFAPVATHGKRIMYSYLLIS